MKDLFLYLDDDEKIVYKAEKRKIYIIYNFLFFLLMMAVPIWNISNNLGISIINFSLIILFPLCLVLLIIQSKTDFWLTTKNLLIYRQGKIEKISIKKIKNYSMISFAYKDTNLIIETTSQKKISISAIFNIHKFKEVLDSIMHSSKERLKN